MSDTKAPERTELWVRAAYGIFACAIALFVYLVLRLPGVGPVTAYAMGPIVLSGLAFFTGVFGLVVSLRRRPFARPPRLRAWACLALVIGGTNYPFPFPARREAHPSLVEFRLPVRGEWTVLWGGEEAKENLLARNRADRRWGLDLLIMQDGASSTGTGAELTDYFAFDQPVYAPADGTVAMVRDTHPDRILGANQFPRGCDDFGNMVVLEVAEDEYAFLCNLKQGSILVGAGEAVELGQELARVGSSSCSRFTPQPHLALHLQDTPVPAWGQAVPWFFNSYRSGHSLVLRGSAQERGSGALGRVAARGRGSRLVQGASGTGTGTGTGARAGADR